MNLRQLRYFVAVAEELHFGRAAERLAISQPPLSQQIQSLEDELGVRLFERTKRSVALTPVGSAWLPEVRQLLEQAESLAERARRLANGETGELTLAFVSSAGYGELPVLLPRFRNRFPGIRVTLQEAAPKAQIEGLLNRTIDAGIVFYTQATKFPEALKYRTLRQERLIAVLPEDWCRDKQIRFTRGALDFSSVIDKPLINFPRQNAPTVYDAIVEYYAHQGGHARIEQEAAQMQTIISLVSAGLGIALVPESLRNLRRVGIRYADLSPQPPLIEYGLLWRADLVSPALRGLFEVAWRRR